MTTKPACTTNNRIDLTITDPNSGRQIVMANRGHAINRDGTTMYFNGFYPRVKILRIEVVNLKKHW